MKIERLIDESDLSFEEIISLPFLTFHKSEYAGIDVITSEEHGLIEKVTEHGFIIGKYEKFASHDLEYQKNVHDQCKEVLVRRVCIQIFNSINYFTDDNYVELRENLLTLGSRQLLSMYESENGES